MLNRWHAVFFVVGLCAGAGITYLAERKNIRAYKIFKQEVDKRLDTRSANKVQEQVFKELNMHSVVDENQAAELIKDSPANLVMDDNAKKQFLELITDKSVEKKTEENKNNEESNDSVENSDISRSEIDQSWSETYRDRVSKFLDDKAIEPDEIDEVVLRPDFDALDTVDIEEVSPLDFVKAVANQKQMQCYIYDPVTRKIYWEFTKEPLTEEELRANIGHLILTKIKVEGDNSPVHWIHPKYFYNKRDNVYSKIESGYV